MLGLRLTVRVQDLDYHLPADRIAQRPVDPRDASRLLVLDPRLDRLDDRRMVDFPDLVEPGSVVVVNDTRVIRARLLGRKANTGGKVELLLVHRVEQEQLDHSVGNGFRAQRWKALGKASKPLRFPSTVPIDREEQFVAQIEGRAEDDGLLEVTLCYRGVGSVADAIERHGHVPLPPYIRREDDAQDAEAYQTVYACKDGAVAAPTAGLHLTRRLLGALRDRGVSIVPLTLHVGPGTFQPVNVDDVDQHRMHAEWFEIPASTAREIQTARARRATVVAIGTTTVRALESAADLDHPGHVKAGESKTSLLIQPGYRFQVVDALLTNFHLPRSTLLALVVAFCGRARLFGAYAHAIERGYRFYSYGDAMFVRCRAPAEAPT